MGGQCYGRCTLFENYACLYKNRVLEKLWFSALIVSELMKTRIIMILKVL